MVHPSPNILSAIAFALWPVQGEARHGPSFDCDDSDTATEFTICASSELSQIEMQMFEAYQELVSRIGEQEARHLADELLVSRQACDGDSACVTERLLYSIGVFNQTGVASTETVPSEPPQSQPIEDDVATIEPAASPLSAEPDLTSIAQAPGPLESALIPPVRSDAEPLNEAPALAFLELPSTEELDEVLQTAELASSDAAQALTEEASFDTPMSWAFMDLLREERTIIQARLEAAGLYDGSGEGSWDRATLEALYAFVASPEGQGFDISTQTGASLALDFIESDTFAAAYQIEAPGEAIRARAPMNGSDTMVATQSAKLEPGADPLAGFEW